MEAQSQPLIVLLYRLWNYFDYKKRRQILLLLLLIIVASLSEMLSIGAVFPFLGILTSPENLFKSPNMFLFKDVFNIERPDQLLLPITVAFISAAMLAGIARLALLRATNNVAYMLGSSLSIDIYRKTLYQSYSVHVSRNSSEIINGIINKVNDVISTISMTLTFIGSLMMFLAILAMLIWINPVVALASMAIFGSLYFFIVLLSRRRLFENGRNVATESTKILKSLQESLGGIRDILLDGTQETYCEIYQKSDRSLRKAQASNVFIGHSPRFGMEALGMLLIAVLAYVLTRGSTNSAAIVIPMLGALALGAQRLLPILQQLYVSWTVTQSGRIALQEVLALLSEPMEKPISVDEKYEEVSSIELRDISFNYVNSPAQVLLNINLKINKGERIGLIGSTGSGKSTLIDLVMGLLSPSKGDLIVNGEIIQKNNLRKWQNCIAHVPQFIFLADASFEENIAFGIPKNEIDYKLLEIATKKSQLEELVQSWPEGYKTMVGERGVRLSGGQRQRIGIARALYKEASIVILDEATSALDSRTEAAVMESINALGRQLTIILIAHRLTTLEGCDRVIELKDGKIKKVATYQDVIKDETNFS